MLDASQMKNLLFPDMDVEKMEFFPHEKSLKVFVDGAVPDVEDGILLGRGILFFSAWESLSIRKFDAATETWSDLNELTAEYLRDLCEVEFLDSSVSLCGFSKQSDQWLEWKIARAQMHAEFE